MLRSELPSHCEKLLRSVFDAAVGIKRVDSTTRIIFRVDWKLNNDPKRPNKRSRSIMVVLDDEAVALWENGSQAEGERYGTNLCKFVEQRLRSFDPQHGSFKFQHPPHVEWTIDDEDLLV